MQVNAKKSWTSFIWPCKRTQLLISSPANQWFTYYYGVLHKASVFSSHSQFFFNRARGEPQKTSQIANILVIYWKEMWEDCNAMPKKYPHVWWGCFNGTHTTFQSSVNSKLICILHLHEHRAKKRKMQTKYDFENFIFFQAKFVVSGFFYSCINSLNLSEWVVSRHLRWMKVSLNHWWNFLTPKSTCSKNEIPKEWKFPKMIVYTAWCFSLSQNKKTRISPIFDLSKDIHFCV